MKRSVIPQSVALASDRACGYSIIRSKLAPVVFAYRANPNGRVSLKTYVGDSGKAYAFYGFPSAAKAEAWAANFVQEEIELAARRAAARAEKQAKRAALKASDHWMVGDVVYTSWGYDQTNVEWYQITGLLPRSVKVREIASNSSDRHGQPGGGYTQPRRGEFVGPEFVCVLNPDGGFKAAPCGSDGKPQFHRKSVSKWDGKAKYTSSYA